MKQEIYKELNDFYAIVMATGNKYIAGGYQVLADSIMKIVEKHEAEKEAPTTEMPTENVEATDK